MNIYITLDYELFFGAQSGTVEQCIIKPTEALLKITEPHNIKFTCFVDVGLLVRLEQQKDKYPELEHDYLLLKKQIHYLATNGHGIELHIHPHWEDSYYDGSKWIFDTSRYKLSDFSEDEVMDIVSRYTQVLTRLAGKRPVAYRAGGWSAQPFKHIQKALRANSIFIDSSVFAKGYYESKNQAFDFRNVPQYVTEYNFSDELTKTTTNGDFTEIPISSMKVSPLFFWKLARTKLQKKPEHRSFGDGSAISLTKKEKFRLLFRPSHTVVSMDGYKSILLSKALKKYSTNTGNKGNFVIIGHPKAFTTFSLSKTKVFITQTLHEHDYKIFEYMQPNL